SISLLDIDFCVGGSRTFTNHVGFNEASLDSLYEFCNKFSRRCIRWTLCGQHL
ncbi:hypothetical protein KI387_015740, partial [Taxus chinensis]